MVGRRGGGNSRRGRAARREKREKTEREMFELSFKRPKDFFQLSSDQQWKIDKELGILDWNGEGLSEEDKWRFNQHYDI